MPRKPAASQVPNSNLHEPSRCGVTQRMWANFAFEIRQRNGRFEGRLNRLDRLLVELHKVLFGEAFIIPAAKVGEKARWYRHRRLPFVRCVLSVRQAIEDAPLKVDERTTWLRYG